MSSSSAPSRQVDSPVRGIVIMLIATTMLSAQDILIKYLSADYEVLQVVFVRTAVALPIVLFVAARVRGRALLRTRRLGANLLRGLLFLAAYICYYSALAQFPIADVVSIWFSAPLFITALAAFILREAMDIRRWAAVTVGFVGILIMMEPGSGTVQPMALLALLSALFYAALTILTRHMGGTESAATITLYTLAVFLVGSGATMPWLWIPPTPADFGLMAAVGIVSATGHLCLAQAYRVAPASTVAPFEYLSLVWAVLFGWFIWGELPGASIVVGVAIVIGSGLYILRRETAARTTSTQQPGGRR